MPEEEVDLSEDVEDYEVVPVGPIRKLEKRLEQVENQSRTGTASEDFVHDVLDIMKSNQKIVNDMTESTHQLKNSVEDLTHKMDEVVDNMNEFMDLLKEASEMDLEGEVVQDMHSRIADAVGERLDEVAEDMKQSNQEVVEGLNELNESIRRSYAASNKDNMLSGQQGRSGRQRRSRQSGDQDGQGSRRGVTSRSQDQESGENERMRNLRKRFDRLEDEEG